MLEKRWQSFRLASPEDKLPEKPPKWWLELEHNKPQYADGMWVTNLPYVNDKFETKKITQNAPGDPNI